MFSCSRGPTPARSRSAAPLRGAVLRRLARAAGALALLAAGCLSAAQPEPPSTPTFDGERALQHVRQLVGIGPRVAGSDGARRARAYIRRQLEELGLRVEEQLFDAATPLGRV